MVPLPVKSLPPSTDLATKTLFASAMQPFSPGGWPGVHAGPSEPEASEGVASPGGAAPSPESAASSGDVASRGRFASPASAGGTGEASVNADPQASVKRDTNRGTPHDATCQEETSGVHRRMDRHGTPNGA